MKEETKGIKSIIEDRSTLKETIIIHSDVKIQTSIVLHENFRMIEFSAIGTKDLGLNTNKTWYAGQVQMGEKWMYINTLDSKTKQPVITYFENPNHCMEFIKDQYYTQVKYLRKLGIKPKGSKRKS